MATVQERNPDATVYVGDLDPQVNESLLWELMLQAGPVVNVHIPKDKLSGTHMGYGFVEFHSEEDADYAIKVMNMVKLFGKPIRVNKVRAPGGKTLDVGANLFIGNLGKEVDDALLYDAFSLFGPLSNTPKVMRDASGESRGFGFVSYTSFDAADRAIAAMNGQYLGSKPITVSYSVKKDSKGRERHGSAAERLLAAASPLAAAAAAPPVPMGPGMPPPMGVPPMVPPPPFPGMVPPPTWRPPGMPAMPYPPYPTPAMPAPPM